MSKEDAVKSGAEFREALQRGAGKLSDEEMGKVAGGAWALGNPCPKCGSEDVTHSFAGWIICSQCGYRERFFL